MGFAYIHIQLRKCLDIAHDIVKSLSVYVLSFKSKEMR